MFKRFRRNYISLFIISQDYYGLPKRMIKGNGSIYHKFKPNIYRDVRNLYQDKASMDMTQNDIKCLTSTYWDKKYQSLTIDMTKDNYTGRYRLGLESLYIPNSFPF